MVMLYSGLDAACFGPDFCEVCDGSGVVWVSDKDRLAEYPGGKLLGMAPGLYEKEKMKKLK